MWTDLRYGWRALRAAPAFTAVAVATLALAIAVNTIAFTILNSLALRPMPVRDAARVVRLYPVSKEGRRHNLVSYPDYQSYRDTLTSFDHLVAYIPSEITLGGDEPRAGLAYAVSANHFPVLGFEPSLGRSFTAAEETDVASGRVAIISHALWQRRYDGRSDAIGKTVVVNGRPFAVVGVGPQRFVGTEPLSPDVWVPLSAQAVLEAHDGLADRNDAWLLVLGRLKAGVSMASAEQEASVAAAGLAAAFPADDRPARAALAPGAFFPLERELKPVVTLVMATISLVLIIACANIANLTLARAAARGRQVAVRLALGAGRWRIVRHHLAESLIVAILGGAAALLLSSWTLRLLYPIGMSLLPETWAGVVLDLTPDIRVFLYTFLLALAAALMFGLTPALQSSSPRIAAFLRDDGTVLGMRVNRSATRDALVVVQIAVCLMLLATAALTARSLQRTRSLDLGFRTGGVLFTDVDLRRNGYSAAAADDFNRNLTARAAAMPGVTDVAWTTHVPLTGGVVRTSIRPEGQASDTVVQITAISPTYFKALSIPLIQGRTFSPEEAEAGAPVVIVSDALARRFWQRARFAAAAPGSGSDEGQTRVRPGSDEGQTQTDVRGGAEEGQTRVRPRSDPGLTLVEPQRVETVLGRRITLSRARVPLTVIGVARDAADVAIWREKELAIYVTPGSALTPAHAQLLVRTTGDVARAGVDLRQAARDLDANLRVDVRPLDDVLRFWAVPAKAAAIAAAVLGGLAMLLASIGIYGMVAFAVQQRTREIGIRMALGARSQDVLALMLGAGAKLVAAGLAAGLAGAAMTTRFLEMLLAGVDPLDPVAFTLATVFLAAAALAATYLPARRALRVDPVAAMRQ